MEKKIYKQAKKRVNAKKGFYAHLVTFIAVGFFFFAINILTWQESRELWFFFPLLPWSIGLIIHYFAVFGLPGSGIGSKEWEAEELHREINRLRRRQGLPPVVEEETEEGLELREVEKTRRTDWNEEDIV